MKFSVLEMTQEILQAMESDEVNSINDTVESNSVAVILRSVFYDLAVDLNLPEHETLFELNASGDVLKPTLMTVPDNASKIHWIKYDNKTALDTRSDMREVNFMPFEEFLERQRGLQNQISDAGEMTFTLHGESFPILYASNKQPQWWTSVDDRSVLFDSYDDSLDSTLQKSKTMCHGVMYPVFLLEDSFIPDIDPSAFSLLKNRAKVRAFAELKQVENAEAVSETRRQKIVNQKRKRTLPNEPEVFRVPRYGRGAPTSAGKVLTFKTRMGS